ncbi:MAG: hypothetical protein ABEJ95_00105 [Candidatus Nanohalobium sp.]
MKVRARFEGGSFVPMEDVEGVEEGARDMVEGNTKSDNSKIRDRIRKLKEDL